MFANFTFIDTKTNIEAHFHFCRMYSFTWC